MSKRRVASIQSALLIVAVAVTFVESAVPARAALGGDITSVQGDQLHMQGSVRATVTASYTVHQIQSAAGTVVREYVSSSGKSAGKVFGIAWQGPWPPDMRQLLGSYFDQYVQAANAQSTTRMGRRPVVIEQSGLVVQLGGHPRAFAGRAYVPEMLPAGVRTEDIQ
ncbi:MAG: DUF2844 domain-containing protein [Candidatus Sulfotelmatobacter sp.]|jgi:uncharacterized protein DUF2844